MALSTCADCGKEVSTNAARCPHCGHVGSNWFATLVTTLCFFGLFVISMVLVAYGFTKLTIATQGVGLIAIGLWFAIVTRLYQASLRNR